MNSQSSSERHEIGIPLVAFTILMLLLISLAAARHPFIVPFVGLVLYYLCSKMISIKSYNEAFRFVVLSFTIVFSVYGYFTHHPYFNTMGPFYGNSYEGSISELIPVDSVKYRKGYLVSYGPSNYHAEDYDRYGVLVYKRNQGVIWASKFNKTVGTPVEMSVKRGLWRDRLEFFASEHSEPGWAYIWRWGSLQEYFVLMM